MRLRREWMVSVVLLLAVVTFVFGCAPDPVAEPLNSLDELQPDLINAEVELTPSKLEQLDAARIDAIRMMARELAVLRVSLRERELQLIEPESDSTCLRMRNDIAAKEKSLDELQEQLRQSLQGGVTGHSDKETKNLPLD